MCAYEEVSCILIGTFPHCSEKIFCNRKPQTSFLPHCVYRDLDPVDYEVISEEFCSLTHTFSSSSAVAFCQYILAMRQSVGRIELMPLPKTLVQSEHKTPSAGFQSHFADSVFHAGKSYSIQQATHLCANTQVEIHRYT